MVLFALLIFVIIIFLALVIDIGRLASAKREKGQSADLLALAFLEAYLQRVSTAPLPLTPGEQKAAFDQGLARAVEVGRQNRLTARWKEEHVINPQDLVRPADYNQRGEAGFVQSARWFPRRPQGVNCTNFPGVDDVNSANRCPCQNVPPGGLQGCLALCDNELGCKDPLDPVSGKRLPANAFRVTLRTRTGARNGIQNLFASVVGQPENEVSNTGTAAAMPRHAVILHDLSRMSAVEKHLPWWRVADLKLASEFGYRCDRDFQKESVGAPPHCMVSQRFDFDPPAFVESKDTGNSGNMRQLAGYKNVWNATLPLLNLDGTPRTDEPCLSGGATTKNCYRLIQTDDGVHFLVDKRAAGQLDDSGGAVFGANAQDLTQPYTSMLQASNYLLNRFATEQSAGDLVGLIGFDRHVVDDNANPPTTATGRYFPLTAPVATFPQFQAMVDMTTPTAATWEKRMKARFFPGSYGQFNDLPLAFYHAHRMLTSHSLWQSSENVVFLVTSGLSSCTRMHLPSDDRNDPSRASAIPECNRTYETHLKSLQEMFQERVKGESQGKYEGDEIRLHVLFIGNNVRPHSIAVHNPSVPNRCMTVAELRDNNFLTQIPNTNSVLGSTEYDNIGTSYDFRKHFEPSYWLSSAAQQVGGLWIPIRTAAYPGAPCEAIRTRGDIPFTDRLNAACAAYTARPRPNELPLADPNKTLEINLKGPKLQAVNPPVPPEAYDSIGRILCDPEGMDGDVMGQLRGPLNQALEDFFNESPISLVEEPAS